MSTVTTRTWAKRAMLLGLFLFVGGFLTVIAAMQDAFAVVASDDPTTRRTSQDDERRS